MEGISGSPLGYVKGGTVKKQDWAETDVELQRSGDRGLYRRHKELCNWHVSSKSSCIEARSPDFCILVSEVTAEET